MLKTLEVVITINPEGKEYFKQHPDLVVHSINVSKQVISLANKSTQQPIPAINCFDKVLVKLSS